MRPRRLLRAIVTVGMAVSLVPAAYKAMFDLRSVQYNTKLSKAVCVTLVKLDVEILQYRAFLECYHYPDPRTRVHKQLKGLIRKHFDAILRELNCQPHDDRYSCCII